MNLKNLMRLTVMLSIATSINDANAMEIENGDKPRKKNEVTLDQSRYSLITKDATRQTKELYYALSTMQGKAILFGQHYANVMGRDFTDWKQTQEKCDLFDAVGEYPAIFGFDFGRGFDNQLEAVKEAARMGGIITISDHVKNPHSPKSYKHLKELELVEVKSVLPGGEYHNYLCQHLDKIADFADKAVLNGRKIPIIFRPWHEHTGAWFWWGTKSATAEEYIALWRFTVEYLRDTKGVDNFIYAYSPSYLHGEDCYAQRNPGIEYFDIAGIDIYTVDKFNESERLVAAAEEIVEYAETHDKVAALTEFGYRGGIQNNENPKWFTEIFLDPILGSEKARKIVYALTWSNGSQGHWVPAKGDLTHEDFEEFYNNPYILFLKGWRKQ